MPCDLLGALDDAGECADDDVADAAALEGGQDRVRVERALPGDQPLLLRACSSRCTRRSGESRAFFCSRSFGRVVARGELEREVEAARLDHLQQRFKARSDSALLPARNHGPLAAATVGKLLLGETRPSRASRIRTALHIPASIGSMPLFAVATHFCYTRRMNPGDGQLSLNSSPTLTSPRRALGSNLCRCLIGTKRHPRWRRLLWRTTQRHAAATALLDAPDALLTRTHLRELGLERRAVDAVFRALAVVALPGYSRPMIRVRDYLDLIENYTFRDDRVRPSRRVA